MKTQFLKKNYKWISFILAIALIASTIPVISATEGEAHEHDANCYVEVLSCTAQEHVHFADCRSLTCDVEFEYDYDEELEEELAFEHAHGDDCYSLDCPLEEHTHTHENCYAHELDCRYVEADDHDHDHDHTDGDEDASLEDGTGIGIKPASEIKPNDPTVIQLYKHDGQGNPLEGAVFMVYLCSNPGHTAMTQHGDSCTWNENDPVFTVTSDEDGFVEISPVAVNTAYILTEVDNPEGYGLPSEGSFLVCGWMSGGLAILEGAGDFNPWDSSSLITIEPSEIVPEVRIANLPETLEVELRKIDEYGTPLEGAEFTLFECSNLYHSLVLNNHDYCMFNPNTPLFPPFVSDENGIVTVTGLEADRYYLLVETTPPAGHSIPDLWSYLSILTTDGEIKIGGAGAYSAGPDSLLEDLGNVDIPPSLRRYQVKNRAETTIDLNVYKEDFDSGDPLEGAVFALYECTNPAHPFYHDEWGTVCTWDESSRLATVTSDENGLMRFPNLATNKYYVLVELTPPPGYDPPSAMSYILLWLDADGNHFAGKYYDFVHEGMVQLYGNELYISNILREKTDFGFYKIDDDTYPVEGAGFTLYTCTNPYHSVYYHMDGDCTWNDASRVSGPVYSDQNGLVTFSSVVAGNFYVLVETHTASGFLPPDPGSYILVQVGFGGSQMTGYGTFAMDNMLTQQPADPGFPSYRVKNLLDTSVHVNFDKRDMDNNQVAGAKFSIYECTNAAHQSLEDHGYTCTWDTASPPYRTCESSQFGTFSVGGLYDGKAYIMVETYAPPGLILPPSDSFLLITVDGQQVTVTPHGYFETYCLLLQNDGFYFIKNMSTPTADIEFYKHDGSYNGLGGAEFALYRCTNPAHNDGNHFSGCAWDESSRVSPNYPSLADGWVHIPGVEADSTYLLVERVPPPNYALPPSNSYVVVTVSADGSFFMQGRGAFAPMNMLSYSAGYYWISNKSFATTTLKLLKVNEQGVALKGAVFSIYECNNPVHLATSHSYPCSWDSSSLVASGITSGDDGILTFPGLRVNSLYILVEDAAPAGYQTPDPGSHLMLTTAASPGTFYLSGHGDFALSGMVEILWGNPSAHFKIKNLADLSTSIRFAKVTTVAELEYEPVEGAQFTLYKCTNGYHSEGYHSGGGCTWDTSDPYAGPFTSEPSGGFTLPDLKHGKSYLLVETYTPPPYTLPGAGSYLLIEVNGTDKTVTGFGDFANPSMYMHYDSEFHLINNVKGEAADIVFYKHDGSKNGLEDAVFALYKCNNDDHSGGDHSATACTWDASSPFVPNETSDSSGMVAFRNLPLDSSYIVVELSAPPDYAQPEIGSYISVDIEANGSISVMGHKSFYGSGVIDVNSDGSFWVANKRSVKMHVRFTKAGVDTPTLEGATFALYACNNPDHDHTDHSSGICTWDGSTCISDFVTSGPDGTINFPDIEAGRYYVLTETAAPPDYQLPGAGSYILIYTDPTGDLYHLTGHGDFADPGMITIHNTDFGRVVEIKNKPLAPSSIDLEIFKHDGFSDGLEGAVFALYECNNDDHSGGDHSATDCLWDESSRVSPDRGSDRSGRITFPGLAFGATYLLVEIAPPPNYALPSSGSYIRIVVDDSGAVSVIGYKDFAVPRTVVVNGAGTITISNRGLLAVSAAFYKVGEMGEPLEGAKFAIYECTNPGHSAGGHGADCIWDDSSRVSDIVTSDGTGLFEFPNLPANTPYIMVEVAPPPSYPATSPGSFILVVILSATDIDLTGFGDFANAGMIGVTGPGGSSSSTTTSPITPTGWMPGLSLDDDVIYTNAEASEVYLTATLNQSWLRVEDYFDHEGNLILPAAGSEFPLVFDDEGTPAYATLITWGPDVVLLASGRNPVTSLQLNLSTVNSESEAQGKWLLLSEIPDANGNYHLKYIGTVAAGSTTPLVVDKVTMNGKIKTTLLGTSKKWIDNVQVTIYNYNPTHSYESAQYSMTATFRAVYTDSAGISIKNVAAPTELDIVFYKKDLEGAPIEGAKFALYTCTNDDHSGGGHGADCTWDDSSRVTPFVASDAAGKVTFSGVHINSIYILVETYTPPGYFPPQPGSFILVKTNYGGNTIWMGGFGTFAGGGMVSKPEALPGQTAWYNVRNKNDNGEGFVFYKTELDLGSGMIPVEGAGFTLYECSNTAHAFGGHGAACTWDENDPFCPEVFSDPSGLVDISAPLVDGEYYVMVETTVPLGYKKQDGSFILIHVTNGGAVVTYTGFGIFSQSGWVGTVGDSGSQPVPYVLNEQDLRSIEFRKVDELGNDLPKGVEFSLYTCTNDDHNAGGHGPDCTWDAGSLVATTSNNSNGKVVFDNLNVGVTYIVVETGHPPSPNSRPSVGSYILVTPDAYGGFTMVGYKDFALPGMITVTGSGPSAEYTVMNRRAWAPTIYKLNDSGKHPSQGGSLAGAEFMLYLCDNPAHSGGGHGADCTWDENAPHYPYPIVSEGPLGVLQFPSIPDGYYILVETKTPVGYIPPSAGSYLVFRWNMGSPYLTGFGDFASPGMIAMSEVGHPDAIGIRNRSMNVKFQKIDLDGVGIKGATFDIFTCTNPAHSAGGHGDYCTWDAGSFVGAMASEADGLVTTPVLEAGVTYIVVETDVPDPFYLPDYWSYLLLTMDDQGDHTMVGYGDFALPGILGPGTALGTKYAVVNREEMPPIIYKLDEDGYDPWNGDGLIGTEFMLYKCTNPNHVDPPGSAAASFRHQSGGPCTWDVSAPLFPNPIVSVAPHGRLSFPHIYRGNYVLVETKCLPGYTLPSPTSYILYTWNGGTTTFVPYGDYADLDMIVTDELNWPANIGIRNLPLVPKFDKVDDGGAPVKGAIFNVYKCSRHSHADGGHGSDCTWDESSDLIDVVMSHQTTGVVTLPSLGFDMTDGFILVEAITPSGYIKPTGRSYLLVMLADNGGFTMEGYGYFEEPGMVTYSSSTGRYAVVNDRVRTATITIRKVIGNLGNAAWQNPTTQAALLSQPFIIRLSGGVTSSVVLKHGESSYPMVFNVGSTPVTVTIWESMPMQFTPSFTVMGTILQEDGVLKNVAGPSYEVKAGDVIDLTVYNYYSPKSFFKDWDWVKNQFTPLT